MLEAKSRTTPRPARPEVTSEPLVIALVYPARTIPAIDEGSFARPD